MFKDTRVRDSGNFRHFSKFAEDVANGQLADFSMIDPIYFGLPRHPADDDHPECVASAGGSTAGRPCAGPNAPHRPRPLQWSYSQS